MRALAVAVAVALAACAIDPRFAGLEMTPRPMPLEERMRVYRLPNGLRVVLLPDVRTNVVTVDARYEVGASDDPPHRAGMAHFAEHVMWEAGMRGRAGAGSLRGVTLHSNASTSRSATHFSATALDVELDRVLEIEARRLEVRCEDLDPAALTRERDVVLEEIKLKAGGPWSDSALASAVWGPGHPYVRGVGGTAFAAAPGDVCAFVAAHYVPAAVTLVVTGNFDAGVLSRIRNRFERIPARSPPARAPFPPQPARDLDRVPVPALEHPTAMLVFEVPPKGGEDDLVVEHAAGAIGRRLEAARWPGARHASTAILGDHRARVIAAYVEVERPEDLAPTLERMRAAIGRLALRDLDQLQYASQIEYALAYDEVLDRGHRLAELVATGSRPSEHRRLRLIRALTPRRATRFLRELRGRAVTLVPARDAAVALRRLDDLSTELHGLDVARAPADGAEARAPLSLPTTRTARLIEDYRLANGLRVLLAPDPDSLAVDARLVFPIGSNADPADRPGLAAAAGTLLARADGWAAGSHEAALVGWYASNVGTYPRGEVSARATTFRSAGLGVYADWHVWSLAWTVLHGAYEARRGAPPSRVPAAPRAPAPPSSSPSEVLRRLLGTSPRPGGVPAPDELERFRRAAYQPRGATLIVSGRFDPSSLRRRIEALFGAWVPHLPPRSPAPPSVRAPRHLAIVDDTASTTQLVVAFAPAEDGGAAPTHELRAARAVTSRIVDDRMRLLREGMGISYGVQGILTSRALIVAGSVGSPHIVDAAKAIANELVRLRAGGPGVELDFVRARRAILARALADPVGATQRAHELEQIAVHGRALDDTDRLVAAIRALSPETVASAASDLRPERRLLIVRGPRVIVEPVFAAFGATPAQIEYIAR